MYFSDINVAKCGSTLDTSIWQKHRKIHSALFSSVQARWGNFCGTLSIRSMLQESLAGLDLTAKSVCLCFPLSPVELKEHLQSFVEETNSQHGPGFIKVVHHDKQEGLIRSRVSGWRAASAPVVALFDAHVEFNIGWWADTLLGASHLQQCSVSECFLTCH